MRKYLKHALALPLLLAACTAPATSQTTTEIHQEAVPVTTSTQTVTQAAWPVVMQKYSSAPSADGLIRFDYGGLKANPGDFAALKAYISKLESLNPDTMNEAQAVSYWGNLYNAVTVKVVVDNYPVKSIRDIKSGVFSPGPWKLDLITVNGRKMSLDDIEHGTMRKKYPSPFVHYMVNCASIGCPNLKVGEWRAETLNAELDQAARDFINSPRGVKVTSRGLVVSSIYSWFDEDFGGSKASVLAHIRQFADADLAAAIDGGAKIRSYDYDWSLNKR